MFLDVTAAADARMLPLPPLPAVVDLMGELIARPLSIHFN